MVNRYFIKFINSVKNKKFLTCLFAFSYLLGIILGVVLNTNKDNLEIIEVIKNYRNIALGLYSNPIKLTVTRILNNFFYFLILYLCCYKIYLCVFNLVIFVYRGIILGSIALSFFEALGIEGIILYLFLIIVQNVLVTFCLFYSAIIIYRLRSVCQEKYTNNVFLKYLFVGYLLSIIVALYEFLFLFLILRPLNLYF